MEVDFQNLTKSHSYGNELPSIFVSAGENKNIIYKLNTHEPVNIIRKVLWLLDFYKFV